MISNTRLSKRIGKKKDPEVVETLMLAKKNKAWNKVGGIISSSRRKYSGINLKEIDEKTTAGDTVVVPGRVLGKGEISKKVRVCAMGFSGSAVEKLKSSKGEIVTISEEIKKNPKAEGVKILR
jgi:large subunit ribosomal protein L18e